MSEKMNIETAYRYEQEGLAYYGIPEGDFQKAFTEAVSASDIETPPLHHRVMPEPLELIEGEKRPIAYYAIPRESGLERIFDSVLKTLTAQNEVGEILSSIKDITTYIVPIMEPIDDLTDRITDLIDNEALNYNIKQNTNIMSKKTKADKQRTWGIVVTVIGALLAYFGIQGNATFLADGFQFAQDIVPTIGFIGAVIGWAIDKDGNRKQNK